MKKPKNPALLLIVLGCFALLLTQLSNNALVIVLGLVVTAIAWGAGFCYWGYPLPKCILKDPVTGEEGEGLHARDLARYLVARAWNAAKTPLAALLYIAFILILIYM
ncbi:hypothetical protein [Pontibacter mucosus]|nr:hypothetical protein [Pontibacter mucosus]